MNTNFSQDLTNNRAQFKNDQWPCIVLDFNSVEIYH